MWYFENYPKISYSTNNGNDTISVVDITKRFRFREDVLKNKYILFKYTIKENEKPFELANSYYNDPTLDWILFLTNKVIDPYFDWPLNNREFQSYIEKKYGSVKQARQTIKRYEWIIQNKYVDIKGNTVPEKKINVDLAQYNTIPDNERNIVSAYDEELQLNENKRQIQVIDKKFIGEITREFKDLYDNR